MVWLNDDANNYLDGIVVDAVDHYPGHVVVGRVEA